MKLKVSTLARLGGSGFKGEDFEIDTPLIDSRSLFSPVSTVFFALSTQSNDGHRYVSDLYRRGVRNFVVSYIPEGMEEADDANFIIVPSPLRLLQEAGKECRRRFGGKVVAIAGSQGKTTLKELLFQLMEPLEAVTRSPRSYNSRIGVPLSLWELDAASSLAIVEAGVSRVGEMEVLREMIAPDVVIFTNIGAEHDEGFPSRRVKAREKVRLGAEGASVVIFNGDDMLLSDEIGRLENPPRLFRWSMKDPDADLYLEVSQENGGDAVITYRYNGQTRDLPVPTSLPEDIENYANALSFLLMEGIESEVIAERFASVHKVGTRLNVSEGVNGCSVIFDSYTGDFSSLGPAVDFLRRQGSVRRSRTLILSDLLYESGSETEAYAEVADLVARAGIDRLICIGPRLESMKKLFPSDTAFYPSTESFLSSNGAADFSEETILLKGAPDYHFELIRDMLEARTHETVMEINLNAIVKNYSYFRDALPKGTGIVCMVKASGYGAGSLEISKTLQDAGAAYLAVAVLDEGIDLRRNGITMPVMVMNPKVENYRLMFAYRLEPEIYSMEMLHDVIREARKNGIADYPIHIKLDTGMHRMGFVKEELPALMDILEKSREVTARSVFSHLATADCPDMDDYTFRQLESFEEYTSYMLRRSSHPILRHILNSAGILRFPQYHYDMARLGIGLYGANTLPPDMEKPLDTVSTLRTVIISLRVWEAGETIGYGRKGVLERKSTIATIPIGYADGMNRRFGNGAVSVLVNGKEAPTIGNICMDACMIDVTGIECKVGDSVEVFGKNAPLQRLADAIETIPYEILTSVSPRVKRVYFRE